MSAKTVIRVTNTCYNLKWLGDLRDWNIGQRERQVIFKDIGLSTSCLYGNWETKEAEPKSSGGDIVTALNDGNISISYLYEVIQAPGFMI